MKRIIGMMLLALAAMGCSATLKGGAVSKGQDADREVDGVRYFGAAQYEISVYVREQRGGSVVFVPIADRQVTTLADTDALYDVGYEGAAFASHDFKVELNPNGTLKSVTLAGKGDSGALTALNAANAVTTKAAGVEKDRLQPPASSARSSRSGAPKYVSDPIGLSGSRTRPRCRGCRRRAGRAPA